MGCGDGCSGAGGADCWLTVDDSGERELEDGETLEVRFADEPVPYGWLLNGYVRRAGIPPRRFQATIGLALQGRGATLLGWGPFDLPTNSIALAPIPLNNMFSVYVPTRATIRFLVSEVGGGAPQATPAIVKVQALAPRHPAQVARFNTQMTLRTRVAVPAAGPAVSVPIPFGAIGYSVRIIVNDPLNPTADVLRVREFSGGLALSDSLVDGAPQGTQARWGRANYLEAPAGTDPQLELEVVAGADITATVYYLFDTARMR